MFSSTVSDLHRSFRWTPERGPLTGKDLNIFRTGESERRHFPKSIFLLSQGRTAFYFIFRCVPQSRPIHIQPQGSSGFLPSHLPIHSPTRMKVLGAQGSLGFEPFKVGAPIVPSEGVGVEYLKVSIFYSSFKGLSFGEPRK